MYNDHVKVIARAYAAPKIRNIVTTGLKENIVLTTLTEDVHVGPMK